MCSVCARRMAASCCPASPGAPGCVQNSQLVPRMGSSRVLEVLGPNLTACACLSISLPACGGGSSTRLVFQLWGRRCPLPRLPRCFCPLFSCRRQSCTGSCAVPSRGAAGVSPCLSGSLKEASASRETEQPLRAAAVTRPAHRAVLRGEGRTPSLRAALAGTEQGRVVRGSSPPSHMQGGWLSHSCHEVCQVAVRRGRGVQGGHGLGVQPVPRSCTVGRLLRWSGALLQGSIKTKSSPPTGSVTSPTSREGDGLRPSFLPSLLQGVGLPSTADPWIVLCCAEVCTSCAE